MKINPLYCLPLIGCLAFVSCYPIPDGPRRPRGPHDPQKKDETVTSQEQQKIQEQRERLKEAEEQKIAGEGNKEEIKPKPEDTAGTPPTNKPKEETKKGDYAFANPVPGKEGFVFSPYNNKLVDVRDIPSGTLVRDPTYPDTEKKYFRVP